MDKKKKKLHLALVTCSYIHFVDLVQEYGIVPKYSLNINLKLLHISRLTYSENVGYFPVR